MQVCGAICIRCEKKIVMAADGIWCGRCQATYHKDCQPASGTACVGCEQPFEDPAAQFVRSEYCPQCMIQNTSKAAGCVMCGASTEWHTKAEYDERRREIQDATQGAFLLGGVLCVIGFGALVIGLWWMAAIALISGLREVAVGAKHVRFR